MKLLKTQFATYLIAAFAMLAGATASFDARAEADASALSTLSALPLASVVVGASAVAGSVAAVPIALSTTGATLVIKTVESTAKGTLYVLERASDAGFVLTAPRRASVEVVGKGIAGVSMVAGMAVVVSVVAAGVVLSAAGEAIAFIPNALGRALLHNERLTD